MFNPLKGNSTSPTPAQSATSALAPAKGPADRPDPLAASASHKVQGDKCFAEGRLEEAAECYRQAVVSNPGNGEAYCGLGMVALQRSLYEQAENCLKQAVSANPELAPAYYFLGDALVRQGKLNEAVDNLNRARALMPDAEIVYLDLCRTLYQLGEIDAAQQAIMQGLAVNPNFADFHSFLGNLYSHQKEFDKAIACYMRSLTLQPDSARAYANLRLLLKEQGSLNQAIASYRDALALNPQLADAHFDLGEALQSQGELHSAADCFRQAIALKPDFLEAYNNLGNLYTGQRKMNEAITCYQQALAIKPDSPEVCYNLALIFKMIGRFGDAALHCQRALDLKPDFVAAHYNLGNVFFEQGLHQEAETAYRRALEINRDFAHAWYGLGATHVAQQKNIEAAICLRRALEIEPDHFAARALLLHELQQTCDWRGLEENVNAVRQAMLEVSATGKNLLPPLAFLAIPGATAEEQKRCAEKWSQAESDNMAPLRDKLGFKFRRAPNDKIRIGYLSGDLRQHALSFLMAEVFELHDRNGFHVTAYSYSPDDGSALRARLQTAFDDFVNIRDLSYEEAARKIHADRIDVLVDLAGHTQESRSAIMALRPAPIQVNYLGYPGTMGAEWVDYILADRFTIPAEKKRYYTEEVVWLPECFQANDRARPRPPSPARKDAGLPDDAFVFCCFNQTSKITPAFFDIWCRLLGSVPGSVLWLSATNQYAEANLRREVTNRGLSAEQIIMAPMLPREDHLARLQCADLFLDTLPFNAGTTCSDALWMGLPVVTCAGDAFASRMAGSLLTAMGVPELIGHSPDDYFRLALDLASDPNKLAAIRRRIIANRDTAPLFDSVRFTRNLEMVFANMVNECTKYSA